MKKIYVLLSAMLVVAVAFGQTAKLSKDFQIKDKGNQAIYVYSTSAERGAITDCPAESLGAQPYSNPATASTSEASEGYAVATEFNTVGGSIETVHLWVASLYNDGSAWNNCTGEDPMTMDVHFIENDGGALGDTLHSFTDQTGTMTAANVDLFDNPDYPVFLMTIELPSGVDMVNGFLLVQGTSVGEPNNCWLMWIDSGDATAAAYQYDVGWTATDNGFTYCLEGTAPDCAAPSMLATSNPTTTSIDVSWDQVGDADNWNIEYGVEGFTPTGTGQINGASDNPITIDVLDPGTSYDFYVQAICDASTTSGWAGPVTGGTLNCDPADQCDYTFDMTDSYGDGWNGAYIGVVEGGLEIAQLDAAGTGEVVAQAICDGFEVDIVWHSGSYDSEIGFTLLDPNAIELVAFAAGDLSADDDGTTLYSFTADCTPPACPAPSDLVVNSTTMTSAEIDWTETGTADTWNIEWGEAGFTQGEGTLIEDTQDKPYTLDALTAGTYYDVYVQADCGAETSYWTGPLTFSTDCDVVSTIPFTEDFEAGIACWTVVQTNPDETWFWSDAGVYEGSHNIACDYDPALVDQDELIHSPEFDLSGAPAALEASFYWQASYYWAIDPEQNCNLFFEVSTDGTTWTPLWDLTDVGVFQSYVDSIQKIDISAYSGEPSVWFGFRYVGNDGGAVYVDLFVIDEPTGIDNDHMSDVSLYPNPAQNQVFIKNAEGTHVQVMNAVGQIIEMRDISNSSAQFNTAAWADGTYFFRIIRDDDISVRKLNIIR